jgi:hypothetical protein
VFIGMPNRLLEDMVFKAYIDIVYKKARNTLNISYSVLQLNDGFGKVKEC